MSNCDTFRSDRSQTNAKHVGIQTTDVWCLLPILQPLPSAPHAAQLTCEAAGLCQQERAPGHEEEEGRLQQREAVQLGELGDVESS